MGHVMIHNTRGKDDVERASLAFLVGNTALPSEQEATLLLTIEGVWIATKGYTEGLQAQGFAPLSELVQQFAARGGQIWVCGACAKPRNITQEHLVEGTHRLSARQLLLKRSSKERRP